MRRRFRAHFVHIFSFVSLGFFLFFLFAVTVSATDFTSASFMVKDPVLYPAGYATSTSYSLTSTIAQIAAGTSTAAAGTAREGRSGFEYFPFVNTPSVSATAGNAQVALTWTASIGVLGWTVSGYEVGKSSVSGGPYTLTNVGLVTSNTASGLTNGTTYYFVVRALDAFGRAIATSSEVSAIPAGATPAPSPGGGGGGGYVSPATPAPATGIVYMSGMAYPNALVHILRDGSIVKTVNALASGNFDSTLTLSSGNYQIGLYADDALARTSALSMITVSLLPDTTTNIRGIFLSPTIEADKSIVNVQDSVGISGYAYPNSTVTLFVTHDPAFISGVHTVQLPTSPRGLYTYRFFASDFPEGAYIAKARATYGTVSSPFSNPEQFTITKTESIKKPQRLCRIGDLNDDSYVDIVDFSIAAFWHKKVLREAFVSKEAECLNNDKKVDIYDFSLMAYYWTG
jgi:hypothetical protein